MKMMRKRMRMRIKLEVVAMVLSIPRLSLDAKSLFFAYPKEVLTIMRNFTRVLVNS